MISWVLEIPAQVVPARISAISESLTPVSFSAVVSVSVVSATVVSTASFLSATTFLEEPPPQPTREIHIAAATATAISFFIRLILFLIFSPSFPFH